MFVSVIISSIQNTKGSVCSSVACSSNACSYSHALWTHTSIKSLFFFTYLLLYVTVVVVAAKRSDKNNFKLNLSW